MKTKNGLSGLGQIKKPDVNRRFIIKLLKSALLVMLCTALMMVVAFIYYIANYLEPNIDIDLSSYTLKYSTSIQCQDSSGNWVEVEQLHSGENREWAALSEIPIYMQNAAIAIEDERFKQHHGVDWKRTFGAVFKLMTGNQSFGGSTITQQLIKNLTGEDTVGFTRKIEEILRALSIEKKYSKDEILEYYLNTIFLSEDNFGVKVAARSYFDKDISQLTLAECASIVGITQYPGNYNPFLHPDRNKRRQEVILGKMLELGMITNEEYEAAKEQKLEFKRGGKIATETEAKSVQSFFTDQIVSDVLRDLVKVKGYSSQIANKQLFTKGWTIQSTMNIDIQNAVDKVFSDPKNFPTFAGKTQPEASIIIMDPYTGAVLAMRGAREKTAARTLNRATQTTRSPGSTIKPIAVYAPAFEYGVITQASVYDDSPFDIEARYPRNYNVDSIGYTGLSTIRNALQNSINTIAVKVLNDVGTDRSYRFLKDQLRITSLKEGKAFGDENLSPLALGGMTNGITLEELVAAYQPFINRGIYSKPYTYTKVLDADGKVILENGKGNQEPIMTEQTAFLMNDLLQSVVNGGTGSEAKIKGIPTAGKTGTTSDNTDRLFVGYTPYYLGGVWFGYDTPKEINLNYNPALRLWKKVMDIAHKNKASKEFYTTTGMVQAEFCMDSGKRPTDACRLDPRGSRIAKGWFKEGTEPKELCDVHVKVNIDKTTNMIATPLCPAESIKTVGLLNYRRQFPYYISIRDAQYTFLQLPPDYIYPTDSMVPVYQNLLPIGFTAGQSPNVKNPMNHLCSAHTPQTKRDSYSDWKGYKITPVPAQTQTSTPPPVDENAANPDTIPVTTVPN